MKYEEGVKFFHPPEESTLKKPSLIRINIIARMYGAKTLVNHISSHWKRKFNSPECHSDQNSNSDTWQCECKKFRTCKEDYSWNSSTCICENVNNLKSIPDISINVCGEIKNARDSVPTNVPNNISTNMTNTISTNATSIVPINSNEKSKIFCT